MKVAVVLAGCGVYDGAEIHESVLTILALTRAGAQITFLAPETDQLHVIDHLTGQPQAGQKRRVRTESARIARGAVENIAQARAAEFDAVVFPGGFGVAKNLCTFAADGPACRVQPDVEQFILAAFSARVPIGFICIAPVLAARVLGRRVSGLQLTIGTDPATARAIEQMGASHVNCPVSDCVIDPVHKIVSTPAYMLANQITEAAAGIDRLVAALIGLI